MERESFVFYRSFAEALTDLDEITRVHCYDAIIDYAINGSERELQGIESAVFKLIKPQIDANNRRFENGLRGGAPKGNQNARKTNKNNLETTNKQPKNNQKQPNVNVNENVNVNVNENVNENVNVNEKEKSKEKTKVFSPPSFQDVNDYCTERHNGVDPQAFIDFYTSKGWMVGKTKMRDWKAAVRTWERRDADSIRSTRISQQDINKAKVEDFFRRNIGGL